MNSLTVRMQKRNGTFLLLHGNVSAYWTQNIRHMIFWLNTNTLKAEGVPFYLIAEMMTEELIHPDAVSPVLANGRFQREKRIERLRQSFFVTPPRVIRSAFQAFRQDSLRCLIVARFQQSWLN